MSRPVLLTVDDSSLQRRALTELFAAYDCEVLQAENGAVGLAMIREHRPDLVLLDCDMPVLDGIGLLQELRADPAIRGTSVIMLTANSAPATLAAVARLGVRDFVPKPHDGPALAAKVARWIRLMPRANSILPAGDA